MIPQGATHVSQDQGIQPPERSLKFMAWNIKEIATSLKEIAQSLSIMNNRFDRMEAQTMKGLSLPMAPAVKKMVQQAQSTQSEEIPF